LRDEAIWRKWAEETRRADEAMTHPSAKHQMHLIAEDYERLAKEAHFLFAGAVALGDHLTTRFDEAWPQHLRLGIG